MSKQFSSLTIVMNTIVGRFVSRSLSLSSDNSKLIPKHFYCNLTRYAFWETVDPIVCLASSPSASWLVSHSVNRHTFLLLRHLIFLTKKSVKKFRTKENKVKWEWENILYGGDGGHKNHQKLIDMRTDRRMSSEWMHSGMDLRKDRSNSVFSVSSNRLRQPRVDSRLRR